MLHWKILKVETKICAIWGILEANLKKSSTLKFITNISFLPSICIHRSIILIFIEKMYACRSFPTENICFAIFDFHFCENPHFREFQALKLVKIKISRPKLEKKIKQNFDLLVRTGSSRDTRNRKPDPTHWSSGCSHSHTSPTRESCRKTTSFTFSSSHLQNFHLFFTDASISDTSAFSPFASTIRKDEIYVQVMGSLSGQVFHAAVINLQVRGTLLIHIQNGRQFA